jgi:trypsin
MREAKVPIVSRAECQTVYTAAGAPIDATMLCAGRTNLDTCQGDSGGPLFFKAVGAASSRPASPAGASAAARPASPGCLHPAQQPGVGNFVLSATGAYR